MKRSRTKTSLFQRARAAELAGRVSEAVSLYSSVLNGPTKHSDALERLSALEMRSGHLERVVEFLQRLLEISADESRYHLQLGVARQALGRHAEALRDYLRALELDPECHEALLNIATITQQAGQFDLSISAYEKALDLRPNVVRAHVGLSSALAKRGEAERSIVHERCAAYLQGARDEGATWNTLRFDSLTYRKTGNLALAASYLYAALALNPGDPELWIELCDQLRCMGRTQGAIHAAREAVRILPRSANAHAALAATLVDGWQLGAAPKSARHAIEIDPTLPDAHYQLGRALLGLGEVDEAIASFRRAVELDENHRAAHSALIFAMPYAPDYSPRKLATEARLWAKRHAPRAKDAASHTNDPTPGRRLRLGYVSEDFRQHPVANFFLPLLQHHNRDRFEIYCYSSVRQPDAITELVRRNADVFREVAGTCDYSLAELIRRDQIDVLVDLALHSGDHRLRTFALRPAPVQICYLGYLGTTGLEAVQYRITAPGLDESAIEDAAAYTEAQLVLPNCYWCYSPLETDAEPGLEPADAPPALAAGFITFGSQNSFHKVSNQTLALWSAVLCAQANSRLIMHAPVEARPRLLAAFAREGVSEQRIEFVSTRPRNEYLLTYRRFDLCLDTIPFNGATTTLDGFWMGTPTLTLVGQTPVGRAGMHICMNLDLPEFVARTTDEFVAKAVEFSNLDRLTKLRRGLRSLLVQSPLMDTTRFIVHLEGAYRRAWQHWCDSPHNSAAPPNESSHC